MAQGKKLTAGQIEDLRLIWIANDSKSMREIHRLFEIGHGKGIISERKAQQLIPTFSKSVSGVPIPRFEYKDWSPWTNKATPESRSFLLTLDAVCQAVQTRHLYQHEAKWGTRLRFALQGLNPYDQFCFVTLYALRSVKSHYEERQLFTTDLDAILAYQPWLPENIHAFNMVALARPASLGDWVLTGRTIGGLFPAFSWHHIAGDHFLPWHLEQIRDQPKSSGDVRERQAADAVLRFWMGPNPVFEPPLGHEEFGLPDLTQPVINRVTVILGGGRSETYEVRRDLDTNEEGKS